MLVSIPLHGYPSLPAARFAGKTVLDTGNYYPQRDGRIEALDSGSLTDSEYLARHLPGARVVKVFNNIFYKHLQNLARPAGTGSSSTGDRTYLPIAGDDAGAKLAVVEFLDSIGYGADDAADERLGDLRHSNRAHHARGTADFFQRVLQAPAR